jgi:hypothetical protein
MAKLEIERSSYPGGSLSFDVELEESFDRRLKFFGWK